jgi:hypothetical protein
MSVIFKYPFGEKVSIVVPWPAHSRVLHVQAQHPSDSTPTLWVLHPSAPGPDETERQVFDIIGTGHPFTERLAYEHVGSAVCRDGSLVWHVFGEAEPPA